MLKEKKGNTFFNFLIKYGGVAQLGEHLLCKQGVIGSIPFISTRREISNRAFGKEGRTNRMF